MSQLAGQLEKTAGVDVTSEELRWRMEMALRLAIAHGRDLPDAAKEFNKALGQLSGEPTQAQAD